MTLEPRDYLQPDETVLLEAKPRLASLAPGLAGTALFAAGLAAGLAFARWRWWPGLPAWVVPASIVALALLWGASAVAAFIRVRTSRYVITDHRLYRSHGRIRFLLVQTTYDKMTDLHVAQGLLGRALGYGSLTANTAGAALALHGLPAPFEVKQQLEGARAAFLRKLVAAHRRRPTAGAEASDVPVPSTDLAPANASHGKVVWSGTPSLQSLLGRLLSAGAMVLAGGVLLALALSGVTGTWFGGLLLLFGMASAASAAIAYKTSRFEVTAAGVVVSTGWLSRRRVETTFSKVTDVTTTQTLLGRLLGYGDIRVNTAGSNDVAVAFTGVAEPQRVKAVIDQTRGARA